jgi:hypothetical protein
MATAKRGRREGQVWVNGVASRLGTAGGEARWGLLSSLELVRKKERKADGRNRLFYLEAVPAVGESIEEMHRERDSKERK